MRVAVIGSSRRDRGCCGRAAFAEMVAQAHQTCQEWSSHDTSRVDLVSGGAAWGDHVAVALFLQGGYRSLTLHLPARLDRDRGTLHDTGSYDWRVNPGRLANLLHRRFKEATGRDSFDDLRRCCAQEGFVAKDDHTGFLERNKEVAGSCDAMLAFGWSKEPPVKGGTAHTWRRCTKKKKKYICIY